MEVRLSPERQAQLNDYARRHGKDPAAALDEALANYLEWERQDYNETVDGVREAYEEVKAGRTRPAAEFLEELRAKHGLPLGNELRTISNRCAALPGNDTRVPEEIIGFDEYGVPQ